MIMRLLLDERLDAPVSFAVRAALIARIAARARVSTLV
jgi:hypothetical protein